MKLLRRIPKLWRYTVTMVFGFSLLASGVMQGAHGLNLPGCVIFNDTTGTRRGEFDLASGRYVRISKPTFSGLGGWLSPDGQYFIYSEQDDKSPQSHTIYLQPIQDVPTVPFRSPVALQEGVFSGAGGTILFSNNRVAWPDKRIAFLWMGLNRKTYLTVVNTDGSNRLSTLFEPRDSTTLVALVTIHGWSGNGRYLSLDEGTKSDYRGSRRFTFWSLDDMQRISTPLDERPVLLGAWSPQGHTFAAVTGIADQPTELVIWSPEAEANPITIPLAPRRYFLLHWSPDGRYFVLASPMQVALGVTSDRWQFDLYARDGQLRYGGLIGTMLNSGTGLPTLYAKWSPDSRLWVYLIDRQQNLDLVGLDVSSGLHHVIASSLASGLAREVFYMSWRGSATIAVDANTVYLPGGNRILLPLWRDRTVTLEAANVDGSNRVRLVEDAKRIIYPQNSPLGGSLWSRDGSEFTVLWSSGSDMRLTLAKADGSDVYTLADNIDDIAYPRDVFYTRFGPRWLGFLTRRNDGYGVEVYDRQTHTHLRLVSGLTAASDSWTLSVNADQTYAAITVGNVATRQTNRLFLAPLNGQPAREIHPDVAGEPVWSADSQQLMYAYRIQPRLFAVEWITLDGTLVGSMVVQARIGASSGLWDWNGCV